MKCTILFLTILVFLHALIVAPLLVECIPADGRCLVEIVGQDPCHGSQDGFAVGRAEDTGMAITQGNCEAADPCLDLIMDNPVDTQICAEMLQAHWQTPERVMRFDDSGSPVVMTADNSSPVLRRLTPSGDHPNSPKPLRI